MTRHAIRPSDLTYNLSACPRCLWLNYQHDVKIPMNMPLVSQLADIQESFYEVRPAEAIDGGFEGAEVVARNEWVTSKPVSHRGLITKFYINGKYDLLLKMKDSRYAVVDCKFTGSARDNVDFYLPQLEAYAYSLEHPQSGDAIDVSTVGILTWTTNTAVQNGDTPALPIEVKWFEIKRDPALFESTLNKFLDIVTSPTSPKRSDYCANCNYIDSRHRAENPTFYG